MLRILSACMYLAAAGIAVPLRGIWTLMASFPGKPEYHHVLMSSWRDPLPWRFWSTCALFLILAVAMARPAAALVENTAVRLLWCLVCVTPAMLLALHHALPKWRFTTVQGYWTTFAGPHEYVPVLLAAAATVHFYGEPPSRDPTVSSTTRCALRHLLH